MSSLNLFDWSKLLLLSMVHGQLILRCQFCSISLQWNWCYKISKLFSSRPAYRLQQFGWYIIPPPNMCYDEQRTILRASAYLNTTAVSDTDLSSKTTQLVDYSPFFCCEWRLFWYCERSLCYIFVHRLQAPGLCSYLYFTDTWPVYSSFYDIPDANIIPFVMSWYSLMQE